MWSQSPVKCLLNSVPTDMEYDTGASLSTISQDTYAKRFKRVCNYQYFKRVVSI